MSSTFGHPPWSPSQLEFLQENYAKRGQAYCAAYLHKTENAVRCKARAMGLQDKDAAWTPQEEEILTAFWQHASFREMQAALSRRTTTAIKRKAAKMQLGPRLQGMISADEGCKLLGVCRPEFDRIVSLRPVHMLRNQSKRILKYDKDQVLAAGKDYFRRETTAAAAERKGWGYERLRNAARKLNAYKIGDEYRLYPEEWDELCNQWITRIEKSHATAAVRNLNVLNSRIRKAAERLLEANGYSVSHATSIAQSLSLPATGSAPSTN